MSIKDPRHDTVKDSSSIIKFLGRKLSAIPALSLVSLIFSPFMGSQTPFEDNNSEDERLQPFPP